MESVINGPSDEHKTSRMVHVVVRAIRFVLQAYVWEDAFKQNGIWRDLSMVSSTIRRELSYHLLPDVASTRPTPEMLRTLWPRNRSFDTKLVMSLVPPLPADAAAPSSSSSGSAGPSAGPLYPNAMKRRRLRSKTSVSQDLS